MKDVISSVIEAENKADCIIKAAVEKAKALRNQGDGEAESIKQSAIGVEKLLRAKKMREAQNNAEKEFEKIVAAAQSNTESLRVSSLKNQDKAVELIITRVFN